MQYNSSNVVVGDLVRVLNESDFGIVTKVFSTHLEADYQGTLYRIEYNGIVELNTQREAAKDDKPDDTATATVSTTPTTSNGKAPRFNSPEAVKRIKTGYYMAGDVVTDRSGTKVYKVIKMMRKNVRVVDEQGKFYTGSPLYFSAADETTGFMEAPAAVVNTGTIVTVDPKVNAKHGYKETRLWVVVGTVKGGGDLKIVPLNAGSEFKYQYVRTTANAVVAKRGVRVQ